MKNTEIKEKRYVYSVFRIHRKKEIEEIGFGEGEKFETIAFLKNLRKYNKIGVQTSKKFKLARHFRAFNKGYPRGFIKYRTYFPKRNERIFKDSRYYNSYVPEIDIPERNNR